MHSFAIGALSTALIIVGLTYFPKESEDYRVLRAILFIWAGINFFVFAVTS